MTRKKIIVFTTITIVTTIWWYMQNMTSNFLLDGIAISSVTVTLIAIMVSTSTWIMLSWASAANKKNVRIITIQNLLVGSLSGYVTISVVSGWVGPLAGIIFGVLSGALCYGMFSIKMKVSINNKYKKINR